MCVLDCLLFTLLNCSDGHLQLYCICSALNPSTLVTAGASSFPHSFQMPTTIYLTFSAQYMQYLQHFNVLLCRFANKHYRTILRYVPTLTPTVHQEWWYNKEDEDMLEPVHNDFTWELCEWVRTLIVMVDRKERRGLTNLHWVSGKRIATRAP